MTLVSSNTTKSPTKILPAPTLNTQLKVSTQSTLSSLSKSSVQQSPQKVIIRQVSLNFDEFCISVSLPLIEYHSMSIGEQSSMIHDYLDNQN